MRLTIIVTANINGFHETHNFLTVFFRFSPPKEVGKGTRQPQRKQDF